MDSNDDKAGDDVTAPLTQSEMDALLLGCIKELPPVDVKTSSWKGTLISIVVISFLCSAIILAIYIINPEIQYQFSRSLHKERIKLSDWLYGKYSARSVFNATWVSDTEIVYFDKTGNFKMFDVHKRQSEVIIDGSIVKQHEVVNAILSPNRLHVLFVSNSRSVFRHSKLANYLVYHRKTGDVTRVKPDEAKEDEPLNVAQWAPVGARLAFVYENNLYHMSVPDDGKDAKVVRVTNDQEKYIYNGIPDWIYEEEILAVSAAFWWSADARQLAYAQFNDSQVELQEYPWYGDLVDARSQYLDRPGRTNPTVKLFVVNVADQFGRQAAPVEVTPPDYFVDKDYYFAQVAWADTNKLLVVWLTREQTYASFSVCSPRAAGGDRWPCDNNYVVETSVGWVDVSEMHISPHDQEHYYTLLGDRDSRDQFVQIFKINIKNGLLTKLTNQDRDVTDILKVTPTADHTGVIIYFTATREGKPGERHVYSIEDYNANIYQRGGAGGFYHPNTLGQPKQKPQRHQRKLVEPQCYTCEGLAEGKCLYNRVWLSRNASNYFHECIGPDYPYSVLRSTAKGNDAEASTATATTTTTPLPWMDNKELAAILSNKFLPSTRHELLNKTDYVVNIQVLLPPNYDDNKLARYPLLINVYAGPGSQNVAENFQMKYGNYLAGSKDIIYAYVDGRGSGYQGERMKHYLYHSLGTVEIEDQIEAAKYLREKYRINRNAIGIWGWSYGGYATAMALAKDSANVFSCGVSVAPVTSWLLYDSAYTERYMGLPDANKKSYYLSDLMHLANNFKNKKYLLIHGTADDNVHIQNSMALIKSLNHANVMFQTQVYPDENHSLGGVSLHLYNRLEQFWAECFKMNSYIEEIGLRRRRIVKQGNNNQQ